MTLSANAHPPLSTRKKVAFEKSTSDVELETAVLLQAL